MAGSARNGRSNIEGVADATVAQGDVAFSPTLGPHGVERFQNTKPIGSQRSPIRIEPTCSARLTVS
jgi:hypothetical protein